MIKLAARLLPCCLLALGACTKQAPPPAAPIAAAPEPELEPEPEPVAPPVRERRVGDDAIAIGTFNLQWAHDPLGDATKLANEYRAKTDEDWDWKVDQIAKVLAEEKLDIVALEELGGQGELTDIAIKIEELGGPEYDWAFVESKDRVAGHHVAVLSRWPIVEQRRFEIHMRRHLAADIELPNGDTITVVAMHAAGGKYKNNEAARAKNAKALKRELNALQAKHPVIVLGTTNSPTLPDAKGYESSAAGLLAGKSTRKEADDCEDSASFYGAQETTVHGDTADRIFVCGLELVDVDSTGQSSIVREETDPDGAVWSQIPIEDSPYRDVSDHLVLWAEVALPEPKPEDEAGGDGVASP